MAKIQHFCKIVTVITCVFSVKSQTNRDDDRQWADGDITGFCKKVCNEECTMCHGHMSMLSKFYPDTCISEIPDPLLWRDSKSYEKCYWLIYKSVR